MVSENEYASIVKPSDVETVKPVNVKSTTKDFSEVKSVTLSSVLEEYQLESVITAVIKESSIESVIKALPKVKLATVDSSKYGINTDILDMNSASLHEVPKMKSVSRH